MQTYLFEARHGPGAGNWGKFLVGIPDETEWSWRSAVDTSRSVPLLSAIGWTPEHIWVHDLQTGEGCFVRPGGLAHADLQKHRVWCCPLFEYWLDWLYGEVRKVGIEGIPDLPRVVDLPDAPFALAGHRRPGGDEPRPTAVALVERMRGFLGHIEDMDEGERTFMLGALTGALETALEREAVAR
jgi:hypothetical protein